MQSAKKQVLLDEFDREYKRLQRPTAAVAKAHHSLRLSNTLRDGSLSGDRKVRQYVGELHPYSVSERQQSRTTRRINESINKLAYRTRTYTTAETSIATAKEKAEEEGQNEAITYKRWRVLWRED